VSVATSTSGTKYPELFAALALPFEPHEVKTRRQAGRDLSYITARTAMNRLDSVLGPENWWPKYRPLGQSSIICELTIRLPDGSTVTKEDAGGAAGMSDAGDDDKSGLSDAIKRAAVAFGVARYLYRDGVPEFAGEAWPDREPGCDDEAPRGYIPPQTQRPAARNGNNGHGPAGGRNGVQSGNRQIWDGPPTNGGSLFRWGRLMEEQWKACSGLVSWLEGWGRRQGLGTQFTSWTPDIVTDAYHAACAEFDIREGR